MSVSLHTALVRTFHAQKNRIRPGMIEAGLSTGQPKILTYLSEHNNCMQKEIAGALDIEPATVSQILNNMEKSGLVRRSAPAERRRAENVSITEKGTVLLKKWELVCNEIEGISMEGFNPGEKEQFVGYLCRMYRNLTGKSLD